MGCKVTVGIPAYNAQDTIAAAAESVLANTWTDLEIIIVNDGSTDDTQRKALALAEKDSRVRVISKENGGVSSARNRIIKEAAGEYITFLDADDRITETCIEKLLSVMEKNGLDWAVCAYFIGWVQEGKTLALDYDRTTFKKDVIFKGEEAAEKAVRAVFFGPNQNNLPSMAMGMYRLSVIRDNGLLADENITFGEDMEFNFRFSRCITGFAYLTERMYYYLRYQDSATVRLQSGDELKGRMRHLAELEKTRRNLKLDFFHEYLIYASIQIFKVFETFKQIDDKKKRWNEYERFLQEAEKPEVHSLWEAVCRKKRGMPVYRRFFLRAFYRRRFHVADLMRIGHKARVLLEQKGPHRSV